MLSALLVGRVGLAVSPLRRAAVGTGSALGRCFLGRGADPGRRRPLAGGVRQRSARSPAARDLPVRRLADSAATALADRGGARILFAGCVVDSSEEESYREAAFRYAGLYNAQVQALVPEPPNLGLQRAAPSRRR